MKVVLDTNVLISGVFFTGLPSRILDSCLEGKYQIVVSPDIIGEYRRVGEEFSGQSPNAYFEKLLSIILAISIVVIPRPQRSQICRDPEDDKFIACAIEGHAKVIVSGDKDLLSILSINDIEILSPRGFITKYMQANAE